MRWHEKNMVRTAHPTARSIHLTDFSCFEAPPRGWVQVPAKPPPYTPCGCEIRVQKGSNPSNTAPSAVGCAVRTKEKSSDAALFPDVPGQQGGAALPGAAGRHPPGHLVRFARGPDEVRGTQKNRPVKRAKRLPAKDRGQGPLTGRPGHDRAATSVSKM